MGVGREEDGGTVWPRVKIFPPPKIVLGWIGGAHVIGVPYPAEYFAFSFLFLTRRATPDIFHSLAPLLVSSSCSPASMLICKKPVKCII